MIAHAKPQATNPRSIASVAEARLQASSYSAIQKIQCEYHQGTLVLRGRLRTFFHTQLAQEAVAGIEGVERVMNQIDVIG